MGVAVLLAHHVHMAPLPATRGFPVRPCRGWRFADQQIAGGVLRPVRAARAGQQLEWIITTAFVARGARQPAQRGKVPPPLTGGKSSKGEVGSGMVGVLQCSCHIWAKRP